jgi:UDP-N-acetyl-D-glucosamine dehydrogenase
MKENLIKKFHQKEAVIGIVGLGYVGLPLALTYVEKGYQVIGFDVNADVTERLSNGESQISLIEGSRIQSANRKGFYATTDMADIAKVDAVILCVPTPIGIHQEPDLSYVISSLEAAIPHLTAPVVVSLESTTYPGTTDQEIVPRIRKSGLTIGQDVFVIYSPEREDPGRQTHTTSTIPKLCGGVTASCLEVGKALYEGVIETVVPVSSAAVAETAKLLENIYRSVNIGLVNEIKMVTDKMGIDIYEVINAAATKPYGFTPFYPGPGIGGHCIPVDPFYLTWKAKEFNIHTRFIELAGEINNGMPMWVVRKLSEALNDKAIAMNGAKVLLLGLAYKPNVDDMREAPSLDIIRFLRERHVDTTYHDPFIPELKKTRKYDFHMHSQVLDKALLESVDAVILVTNHDNVDYNLILKYAPLIIDTRGHFPSNATNVVRA